MRFLLMHRLDESLPEAWNPSPEFIEKLGGDHAGLDQKGILITAEGVHPSSKGALVRKARGGGVSGEGRAVCRGEGSDRRFRPDQRRQS